LPDGSKNLNENKQPLPLSG